MMNWSPQAARRRARPLGRGRAWRNPARGAGDGAATIVKFKKLAAKVRAITTGRRHTRSETLLREGRDER